ncbi:MAG: thiamine phosphate synthase [Gammaproteobacteria bacterium]|nr:MAG: thiamine phosphate synthase [Gammaproteobacteria bacterium]
MNSNKKLSGVYAITSDKLLQHDNYLQIIKQKIDKFQILQYRNKSANFADKKIQAIKIQKICKTHNIPLIINDDIKLCQQINACGVHIGDQDKSLAYAKRKLKENSIIGISCYADIKKAQKMQQEGASYVAFGRLYPSITKPQAPQVSLKTIVSARKNLSIPVCAIGGIKFKNITDLQKNNIDLFAMCDAIWGDF